MARRKCSEGRVSDPSLSPKLLEALVCPACGGSLEYDREAQELISRAAHL
ncbi:MAG: Trm112 family protein, partial [Pseudomonadota bacterium]